MDLNELSTPQLLEIKKIITAGVSAVSEKKENESVPDTESGANEEASMDKERIEALEAEKQELKSKIAELEEKIKTFESESGEAATKVADLEKSSADQLAELEELRTYKQEREAADARAEKIKAIKESLTKAGLEEDVDSDPEYWLSMSEDVLAKTIAKLTEAKASKPAEASINVPQVQREDVDNISLIRQGLKERKESRGK